MLIVILIPSILIVLVGIWYWNKISIYHKIHVDGPKPLPVIGNAHMFINTIVPLQIFYKIQKVYGRIFKILNGPYTYLAISNSELAKFVLSSDATFDKSRDYDVFKRWFGISLFTLGKNNYNTFRKGTVNTLMHFKNIETKVSEFGPHTETLIRKLKNNHGCNDICQMISLCTLDIICGATLDVSINAQENENSEYVNANDDLVKIITKRITNIFTNFDFIYRFTSDYKREIKALQILNRTTKIVVDNLRSKLKNNKNVDIEKSESFLKSLLELRVDGKTLTDNEIFHAVNLIIFAGHDTQTSSISFVLYLLAEHKNIQKKVREEIYNIFGKDKRFPSTTDLNDMKYLDMVIKESMRMYPTIPAVGRKVSQDLVFKGINIPKETNAIVFLYAMSKDPDVFPEPFKFDPERYTAAEQAKRHPYSFLPFSGGPRVCPGQKFGMYSIKFIITQLLRNFEFDPVEGYKMELEEEIVMKPKNGDFVKLVDRTKLND